MRHHFFDGGAFYRLLYLQEYLLTIQEIEEHPANKYKTCIEDNLTNLLREETSQTAKEELIDTAEADDSLSQVDSD